MEVKKLTQAEQKQAAKHFSEFWKDKGYEKGEGQKFWSDLLSEVLGVQHIAEVLTFEEQVKLDKTNFIDVMIPETHVMIEQKGSHRKINEPIKQSDGSRLTPFQQAQRYSAGLPYSQRPRWIVICNFIDIAVYDMERPGGDPEIIHVADLEKDFYRLSFLVKSNDEHIRREMEMSLKAGELVGKIHDRFLEQYNDPMAKRTQNSLNILCVRLVFCLYAEDAGLLGPKDAFSKYIEQYPPKDIRQALLTLFKVLDTPYEDRPDMYLSDELEAMPYCNGGLFANENIVIPKITDEIKNTLLDAAQFDWSEISPTIFGAVFESTLNPETRRSGGMHYTSIENIHKVIDPLFLNDLKEELEKIEQVPVWKQKKAMLEKYQAKLAGLTFLDPACGSGNFLTETYISLRRLENRVIAALQQDQISFGFEQASPIQVSIAQFYGIEINDFAVTVARTALWIAESQMMQETEGIVHMQLDFLPLKTNASIIEANALRIDWNSLIHNDRLSYIMGNPPFVGYSLQSPEQKSDILNIYKDEKGKPYKTAGKIDYVSGWYWKASELMVGTAIKTAFVSTNSITQGEQVAAIWKPLYERFGIHIDFAYRTFIWDSEASAKAHVHCVVVGLSCNKTNAYRMLFDNDRMRLVENISPYLVAGENIFIESRKLPISDVPIMISGNRPTDGGYLILSPEEKDELLNKNPDAGRYIKRFMMGYEFINRKDRYCLWLVDATPSDIKRLPEVAKRVELCRQARLESPDEGRQRLADTPHLFREQFNPVSSVVIPKVSSERRRYIPMGYLTNDTIAGDKLFILPNAGLYHFGILMSNVHMAWVRAVTGRLKSDYSYSIFVDYNCFVWPDVSEQRKAQIEHTARGILDARANYPTESLADLYDETLMPSDLRKAHQANDRAVMAAYGWEKGHPAFSSEAACVAELMRMYQRLTAGEAQ